MSFTPKLHPLYIYPAPGSTTCRCRWVGGEAPAPGNGSLLLTVAVTYLTGCSTPFLELGQFAGYGMYDDWIPAAGVVTGIGSISG